MSTILKPPPQSSILNPQSAIPLLLVIAIFAVFGRGLFYPFIVYDTFDFVVGNPHVRTGLSLAGVRWAWTTIDGGYWTPLTWLSHMLDCQLFGLRPFGHHLSSLALHILNTLLLFEALRRLTGARWRSAVVAAIFALHPMRVESVVWIAERKDVLSSFFWMLALLAYARYVRGPFSVWRYACVAGAFVLGLLAKPSLVTLPFVLLLLDFWPLRRLPIRNRMNPQIPQSEIPHSPLVLIFEKIPLVLLALACSLVTYRAQAVKGVMAADPLSFRLEQVPIHYAMYLQKTFWPFSLSVLYPLERHFPPFWRWFPALLLICGVSLAALFNWRRRPYLLVGWFWFLGTLVPMIGFVQVYMASIADRYTYISQIGLAICIAWGTAELAAHLAIPKRAIAIASGFLILLLAARAFDQSGVWRDDVTLWSHAVATTQNNDYAYFNLAASYEQRGDLQAALAAGRQSAALDPTYPPVYLLLGRIENNLGDRAAALKDYLQGLKARKKMGITPADTQYYFLPADLLADMNRFGEAEALFEEAAQKADKDPVAYVNLGTVYGKQGNNARAEECFRKALEIDPNRFLTNYNYGFVLRVMKKNAEAVPYLERAAALDPKDTNAAEVLGDIWSEKGNRPQANQWFQTALQRAQTAGYDETAKRLAGKMQ